MKAFVSSKEDLAAFFDQIPPASTDGVVHVRETQGTEWRFRIADGKLCEVAPSGARPIREFCEGLKSGAIVSAMPESEMKSYADVWQWVSASADPNLHLHKERFRELLKHHVVKRLGEFSLVSKGIAEFHAEEASLDPEYIPNLPIARIGSQLGRTEEADEGHVGSFSPFTEFAVVDGVLPQVGFEGLVTLRLIQKHTDYPSIIEKSVFSLDKTTDALRELIRAEAITHSGGEDELFISKIVIPEEGPEHQARTRKSRSVDIQEEAPQQAPLSKPRLRMASFMSRDFFSGGEEEPDVDSAVHVDNEILEKSEARRKKRLARVRIAKVTDEHLFHAVAYILVLLWIALPWFLWKRFFAEFGP